MVIFLFGLIVAAGLVIAYRLLSDDMYVSLNRQGFAFPWRRRPRQPVAVPVEVPPADHLPEDFDVPMRAEEMPENMAGQVNKLDLLLLEKNKLIDRLQTELDAERENRRDFEKVKDILDGEIKDLRSQLRSLKKHNKGEL
jgi:hypothetical protein